MSVIDPREAMLADIKKIQRAGAPPSDVIMGEQAAEALGIDLEALGKEPDTVKIGYGMASQLGVDPGEMSAGEFISALARFHRKLCPDETVENPDGTYTHTFGHHEENLQAIPRENLQDPEGQGNDG